MSIVTTVAISAAAELFTVMLLMGIHAGVSDCQSVDRQVKNTDVLPVSSPPHSFLPFLSLSYPIPFLPSFNFNFPLRSRPLIAAWELGSPAAKRILVHCRYKLAPF